MHIFTKSSHTHQEYHAGQGPIEVLSRNCCKQFPWRNYHLFCPSGIPLTTNCCHHRHQERFCRHWRQDPPPNHRGPPSCSRCRPLVFEEALQLGDAEGRSPPSIACQVVYPE